MTLGFMLVSMLHRAIFTLSIAPVLVFAACSSDAPGGGTATPQASTAVPEQAAGSSPIYAPGWSAVHADGANSDYSPAAIADAPEMRWRRSFDGPLKAGALEWTINLGATVPDSGMLYLTTTVPGCHLQAIDTTTGATAWCSAEVNFQAVVSSPLIDSGGRLFLADGTAMRSFAPDGSVVWTTPIVGVPLSAQFTPAGNLFFITHVGIAYILDRASGDPVMAPFALVPGATWDGTTGLSACAQGLPGCPSANTPAIDARNGRVFFTFWEPGAEQAGVRAMRIVEDGPKVSLVPLWENSSLPGGSASSPTLSADGSRVYVTDNVDSVHALDAETGESIWKFAFGAKAGGSVSISPEGVIMAAGGDLQAIEDVGDHAELLWKWDGVANHGIATQAAGNRAVATVAAGGRDVDPASRYRNDLVVIDTRTGAELSRVPIEGATVFSVGITIGPDGSIYVPFIQGDLLAFGPAAAGR